MTRVLGIETSCDETSAAVLEGEGDEVRQRSLVILSQDVHRVFGGVVPEIASRAHLEALGPTMRRALATAGIARPDIVAATIGPGPPHAMGAPDAQRRFPRDIPGTRLAGLNPSLGNWRLAESPAVEDANACWRLHPGTGNAMG